MVNKLVPPETVAEIRRLYKTGEYTMVLLEELFNVKSHTIRQIIHNDKRYYTPDYKAPSRDFTARVRATSMAKQSVHPKEKKQCETYVECGYRIVYYPKEDRPSNKQTDRELILEYWFEQLQKRLC